MNDYLRSNNYSSLFNSKRFLLFNLYIGDLDIYFIWRVIKNSGRGKLKEIRIYILLKIHFGGLFRRFYLLSLFKTMPIDPNNPSIFLSEILPPHSTIGIYKNIKNSSLEP